MNRFYFILTISILFTASDYIYAQQTGKTVFFDNAELKTENIRINTEASEFGVAFVKDDLWYTAYSDKDVRNFIKGKNKKLYFKQFRTPIDKMGNLLSDERSKVSDFETSFHEGPIAFSKHTNELFLTLSNIINVETEINRVIVKRTKMRLRIAIARKENEKWTIVEEMPFNDPIYSVGHPTTTSTGDTIFFTSDIPDNNLGETDIFMSVRENGEWSSPANLGKEINTNAREMFPFFHKSGILIFASDKENGKGGLDLYYSKITNNKFSSALPIEQLNTTYDDFGFILHPNSQIGYFVSNRPGYNGDDNIFKVSIIQ